MYISGNKSQQPFKAGVFKKQRNQKILNIFQHLINQSLSKKDSPINEESLISINCIYNPQFSEKKANGESIINQFALE